MRFNFNTSLQEIALALRAPALLSGNVLFRYSEGRREEGRRCCRSFTPAPFHCFVRREYACMLAEDPRHVATKGGSDLTSLLLLSAGNERLAFISSVHGNNLHYTTLLRSVEEDLLEGGISNIVGVN